MGKIVSSWPTKLNTSRSRNLRFAEDTTLEQTLTAYIEDYGREHIDSILDSTLVVCLCCDAATLLAHPSEKF